MLYENKPSYYKRNKKKDLHWAIKWGIVATLIFVVEYLFIILMR